MEEASGYELPFEFLKENVKPIRDKNNRATYREKWWIHAESRPAMREAIKGLSRYIATPRVSKHRIFIWIPSNSFIDSATFLFSLSDDYFFGVLHSKLHELWALRQGTSLEDRPRYTPTTTFETFPFPWSPSQEPKNDPRVKAIAEAAKQLDDFRNEWLNPQGDQFIDSEKALKKRTLTNLYNALALYREEYKGKARMPEAFKDAVNRIISLDEIEMLEHIHAKLDHAVLDAYGWQHNLSNEQILENLLALNLERANR
jgi:hypothetical protein